MAVGMRRVHDRGAGRQAALAVEQLDRPQAVLGEALLDLAPLLVGVDVQRQLVARGVAAELGQRRRRAGAHGVGGDTDADSLVRGASRARAGTPATDSWRNRGEPPRR